MIEKYNIPLQNKDTKKIEYQLWLDDDWWYKYEFGTKGNIIHCEARNSPYVYK